MLLYEYCIFVGHGHAGLQNGSICNCGYYHSKYNNISDSDCSKNCEENSSSSCGALHETAVYQTFSSESTTFSSMIFVTLKLVKVMTFYIEKLLKLANEQPIEK